MHLIIENIHWMSFNVFLAVIPVLFGYLMRETKSKILRLFYGFIWILFLPNTLYMITDITHFFEDIYHISGIYEFLLVFQYLILLILAVVTYFAALIPAEKLFVKTYRWNKMLFITIVNILIGFGITLGRIERTNSWYIITKPYRVITDVHLLFSSPNLLVLTSCFIVLASTIYISFRYLVIKDKTE